MNPSSILLFVIFIFFCPSSHQQSNRRNGFGNGNGNSLTNRNGNGNSLANGNGALTPTDPCKCHQSFDSCGCVCNGAMTNVDFLNLPRRFSPCSNFQFIMSGGDYYAFPPNFFSRVGRVKQFLLQITDANFQYLFDPTPRTSAFRGVRFEQRAIIRLSNVRAERSWNWLPMWELTSVYGEGVEMEINGCALPRLSADYSRIALGQVKSVKIAESNVDLVGGGAFATFYNMTHLLLPFNSIRSLRRDDLPKPATFLREIDLMRNKLRSVDRGMFSDMPALRKISLEGNPIASIEEETFRPIIGLAIINGISDFPLHCDCRLRWLKDPSVTSNPVAARNMRGATCKLPLHLRGTPLRDLSSEHLLCNGSIL